MKFLKEWSLLFVIFFSSFLKASADQAAEVTPQEEVTVVRVKDIWNQAQLIKDLSEGHESLHNEKLQLVDLYTRFVDPANPTNVRFYVGDLLKFFSKRDLMIYVTKARRLSKEKREIEGASHLAIETEFIGAEALPPTGRE